MSGVCLLSTATSQENCSCGFSLSSAKLRLLLFQMIAFILQLITIDFVQLQIKILPCIKDLDLVVIKDHVDSHDKLGLWLHVIPQLQVIKAQTSPTSHS